MSFIALQLDLTLSSLVTTLEIDAIVNAANERCLGLWFPSFYYLSLIDEPKGGGGIDGAIHNAAGEGLYEECKMLPVRLWYC